MYDYDRTSTVLMEWGPRLLAAAAILLVAHFVGKGVQWGLAKLIDRFPGAARHNVGLQPKQTIGYKLGQLGYWLVLLIGLIAALGVLGLEGVVTPLNTLTTGFLTFVPNIVGAAVIFFVGMLLATIAKRVVEMALSAAHVDAWLDKAGLTRTTGASGLSKAAGTLVFVLIIIPATIAALEQLGIAAISEPAVQVLSAVLAAIPRVVAALIVLALAFFIGRWVASLVEQLLPSLGFDRMFQGVTGRMRTPPTETLADETAPAAVAVAPSKVVGQLVLAAIVLFSAVEAARLLEFAAIASMLQQILELAAHVLFGGVIITAGVLIANFLARLIETSTGGADSFASILVRWATIALATAMGLRFMGIADEIVILAFGLILGSAAVAAALAFGIGGRETAHRLLERWTAQLQGGAKPPPPRRPPPAPPPV
ncbi:MAG TPA: mechanosensitive ion channel [Phenylobacterium sp.]|nr:mechanosensitive ion channel [Phenylobacterium sp.]